MADILFQSLCCALVAISIAVSLLMFAKQPTPYLDEIFHIPQAQKYCNHEFSKWDPKITTLPGLYLFSLAIIEPLAIVFKQNVVILCSPFWLRAVNLLFLLGNVLVLRQILLKLHVDDAELKSKETNGNQRDQGTINKCAMTAATLGTFPLLYFFTFLYYTDIGSTFMVLLMYYFSVCNWHFVAALTGYIAILFRQSNFAWVVFTAGTAAARMLLTGIQDKDQKPPTSLISTLKKFIWFVLGNLKEFIWLLWPYAITAISFVMFVFINKGIVVGDRSSHESCLNFPQFFYLLGFTLFFSWPHLVSPSIVCNFLSNVRNIFRHPIKLLAFLLTILLMFFLIFKFTYVHKYLLADNRHYPFYVWRKLYGRHWTVKYALIPVYLYSGWGVHHLLSSRQHFLWHLVFVVCVAMVTVPQKLLEFRYFIMPYVMYRIHAPLASRPKLFLEAAFYAAVNVATLYLFLEKPFHWPHEPQEVQRFMW